MILKIIDGVGTVLGAVEIYENNFDGKVFVNDTFHCEVDEITLDSIFGSNDAMAVIRIDNHMKRQVISDEIVADIVSQRAGLIYDDEILCEFTDDYFASELEIIRQLVDEKMHNHLKDDNLTVKK